MTSLALLIALFAQSGGQPVNIPIQNPSFEAPVPPQYQTSCGPITYKVPGWTSVGTAGVLTPISPRPCDFSSPPDGKQMVVILDGEISQDLGNVYGMLPHDKNGEVNGIYRLTFSVANYFYWYNGRYSASISLAATGPFTDGSGKILTLCSTSGIAMGDFAQITLVCPAQRKYGELTITLGSGVIGATYGYYQNLFDNVSLTFTPE